jgi:hypothetical protein
MSKKDSWIEHNLTNRILLLTSKLSGGLEVDTKIGEVALVIFADVLYRIYVERNCKPMDR